MGEMPSWVEDQWRADLREEPITGGCLPILVIVAFVCGVIVGKVL